MRKPVVSQADRLTRLIAETVASLPVQFYLKPKQQEVLWPKERAQAARKVAREAADERP
jgi:hypothetical protein